MLTPRLTLTTENRVRGTDGSLRLTAAPTGVARTPSLSGSSPRPPSPKVRSLGKVNLQRADLPSDNESKGNQCSGPAESGTKNGSCELPIFYGFADLEVGNLLPERSKESRSFAWSADRTKSEEGGEIFHGGDDSHDLGFRLLVAATRHRLPSVHRPL